MKHTHPLLAELTPEQTALVSGGTVPRDYVPPPPPPPREGGPKVVPGGGNDLM